MRQQKNISRMPQRTIDFSTIFLYRTNFYPTSCFCFQPEPRPSSSSSSKSSAISSAVVVTDDADGGKKEDNASWDVIIFCDRFQLPRNEYPLHGKGRVQGILCFLSSGYPVVVSDASFFFCYREIVDEFSFMLSCKKSRLWWVAVIKEFFLCEDISYSVLTDHIFHLCEIHLSI